MWKVSQQWKNQTNSTTHKTAALCNYCILSSFPTKFTAHNIRRLISFTFSYLTHFVTCESFAIRTGQSQYIWIQVVSLARLSWSRGNHSLCYHCLHSAGLFLHHSACHHCLLSVGLIHRFSSRPLHY